MNLLLQEGLKNNRQLRYNSGIAKALGVRPFTISQYRGSHNMSVTVAVKVAELLSRHPMETIAATMYWQSKGGEEKSMWEYYYALYK